MLFIFIVSVLLQSVESFDFNCLGFTELYAKGDQVLQVRRDKYSPDYLEMDSCNNTSNRELMEYEPERILQNISISWLVAIPWPFEHATPTLTRVQMNDLTSFGVWGDCSKLEYLYAKQGSAFANSNNFTMVPPDWLINCTHLTTMDLRNLTLAEIRAVLDGAHSLESLKLYHIKDIAIIGSYPLILQDRPYQQIKYIALVDFSLYANLTGHKTTWAEISANLVWQLSLISSLESLEISDRIFDLCAPSLLPVQFGSLINLKVRNSNTTRMCLKKYNATKISHIALWAPPLFDLKFGELFAAPAPQLTAEFSNFGNVVNFELTRDDYLALSEAQNEKSKKGNVVIKGVRKSIKCDCRSDSFWFARAVRSNLVTVEVTCTDNTLPADLSCDWLDCDRISCDSPCVCCREEQDSISVDCRDADLDGFPTELLLLPNITRLIASSNNITMLPDYLPDTLLQADLSGNDIWLAGAKKVDTLFAQPKRRLRLSQNDLVCSCDNKLLISQLQNNSNQIEDFKNITCAVTFMKLEDVDVSKLCEAQDHAAALLKHRETLLIATGGAVILGAVSAMLSVVLYYRRHQIQMFLFSRGWCLWCVTEEELDSDRRFDIFISFCHTDTALVVDELLPQLDRDYSVCLHLRDWYPGETIPTQIAWSVEQSRRTIVILSRSFVRSLWGNLEFQTAYTHGLEDGRTRVLMIILDDVLEKEQLTAEMRSYVRLNTYVRWDDPWFWEKLRYALPHRPLSRVPPPPVAQESNSDPRERYIVIEEI